MHLAYSAQRAVEENINLPFIYFLDSGRSALVCALRALGVGAADEVILSSFNCPAVIDAICSVGATPVFVDVNNRGGINVDDLERRITFRTKALLVTHIYGIVEDLSVLQAIATKHHCAIINDLAQTFELLNSPKRLHENGDISIYSFGAEKHIHAWGGGSIGTHDAELSKKIQEVVLSISIETHLARYCLERFLYYIRFYLYRTLPRVLILNLHTHKSSTDIVVHEQITPRTIHPFQLFLLDQKLKTYPAEQKETIANAKLLEEKLGQHMFLADARHSNSHLLYATIIVDPEKRFMIARRLAKDGIQTTWNYVPLYYYEAYEKYQKGEYPSTERLWKQVLSVPFRYPLTRHRVQEIAERILAHIHED
ncbi:MAG: hypothetical protein A3A33_01370 [Candidatus Yanofskybacteria bacterium RIFCSPLOWO2_01_FULL_49_25]|uniref:Uncharacterized protein n=1 Tax=Candidatus Yanofskybacteria bacterium RIFCSPLOWO2_01_FULL_49_25 TaxID=1802701 RepID=A0A1F8GX25_9BACT|nr:MAG: hypothetical protein A3A33_01370 [Candidatus Yanofskybacteria bacterium RIFCSPLOWO2_01_FULL_49_25]